MPDNVDPGENVPRAQEAIKSDPSLEYVVHALQTIATAPGCNPSVREALGVFRSLRVDGKKRIERILGHFGPKVPTVGCLYSLNREFNAVAQFDDPKVIALIERFS